MTRDLNGLLLRPFPEMARRLYQRRGWLIIEPSSSAGVLLRFELHDWHADSFLAHRGNEIEAALLRANRPGRGAFTTLERAIVFDGYRFSIAAPLGRFRLGLERRGWQCADLDHERGEIWRRTAGLVPEVQAAQARIERGKR